MKKQDVLKFQISGGLGNQLFQYAAGQFIASMGNHSVNYEISRQGKFHEGSEIASLLGFSQVISTPKSWGNTPILLIRIHNFFAIRSGIYRKVSERFSLGYFSPVVGYDPCLEGIKRSNKVHGYFQSRIYAEAGRESIRSEIFRKARTRKMLALIEESKISNPVMVHIRRGDYLSHRKTIGVLSYKYFDSAIKKASAGDLTRPIWVFTDNKDQALKLISEGDLRVSRIFGETDGLDAIETLELMATGMSIVISNSTFSWWAAFLNSSEATIIHPSEWYRGLEAPGMLIPSHWFPVDSHWEN
jgi:hypothetical protein